MGSIIRLQHHFSQPSIRGTIITIASTATAAGIFIAMAFGTILSWRQTSFICALFPMACFIAVSFVSIAINCVCVKQIDGIIFQVPETPSWLLSKHRVADALKSLQWLRGWVTPQTVQKEFEELQNYAIASTACATCVKKSIECCHQNPTILDKITELKRWRNLKPMIFMILLQFFGIFNGSCVWEPYIVQVVNALGTPLKPSYSTVITSGMGVIGSLFLGLTVKKLGRRPIYLTASVVLALCCFGLSMYELLQLGFYFRLKHFLFAGIYGFTFFPMGWTSFKKDPNEAAKDPVQIGQIVGHFKYVALGLVLLLKFCGKAGTDVMSFMFIAEVYPFK